MGQWLRLCASTAGGLGSIPSWEAKSPHTMQVEQPKKKNSGKNVTTHTPLKQVYSSPAGEFGHHSLTGQALHSQRDAKEGLC